MGGFLLYTIVEYLIRGTVRAIKRQRSRGWPTTKATIISATHNKNSSCDLAEVVYAYHYNGERYSGRNKKPFLFSSNAEIYVNDFQPGKEFTVRVKPTKPEISIVP